MRKSWSDFYAKKRMEKKASKKADQTHLTYSWLRADQAQTQLEQLARSHDLTPVVMFEHNDLFEIELEKTIEYIKSLKHWIKKYQDHLKTLEGKR